ncbi:MAG: hypothetical protein RL020_1086 [Pseudomonadota bacterium]
MKTIGDLVFRDSFYYGGAHQHVEFCFQANDTLSQIFNSFLVLINTVSLAGYSVLQFDHGSKSAPYSFNVIHNAPLRVRPAFAFLSIAAMRRLLASI